MIVYKSRHYPVRRCEYGGSGQITINIEKKDQSLVMCCKLIILDIQMLILLHSLIIDCFIWFPSEIDISWTDGGTCHLGWYPDTNSNAPANNTGFAVQHRYLITKPNPKGSFP